MAAPSAPSRILVPLDGSELSETALPTARRLARALQRPLELVRVITLETLAFASAGGFTSPEVYERLIADEEHETFDYLRDRAAALAKEGLAVATRAFRGQPADALIDLCRREDVGLIVMTTNGRTGVARLTLGSVADHLVRQSRVPVLLLRPGAAGGEECEPLDRAIVPLDGSPVAEAALDAAAMLAGAVVRELTLVRVIRGDDAMPDDEAGHTLDDARERLAQRIGDATCAIQTLVLHGDAAGQIVGRARERCELIIMATRGQTGARRWAFGSTADRVLRDSRTPLLLVSPPQQEE